MGAKGSSSITGPPIFQTEWGYELYNKQMVALHWMATPGQVQGIIDEIRRREKEALAPTISAPFSGSAFEYKQTMNDIEAYEELLKEGNT